MKWGFRITVFLGVLRGLQGLFGSPLMKMFPEFFKVYLPEHSANRMLIPKAFVEHFNDFIPERAILRDSVGRVWHMEVGRIGKDVFFQKGWKHFLIDNLVEEGDFFVFQYDGSYTFDFKLFGTTGCEKKDAREVNVEVHRKRFFLKGEEDVEEVESDEEDDDYDDDYEAEEEEEEEEEEESQSKSSNKALVVFQHTYSGRGPELIGENKQTATVKARTAHKKSAHTKSKYKKACTGKIDELENSLDLRSIVQPENPYFVAKLRPGRRSKLYVPADVLKDHNIVLPPRVLFRDPHGRSWPGDVAIWKDGRAWIGGWRPFCKWNHVHEHDSCICEFVEEKGYRGNVIVVHIHRAQPASVKSCNANPKVERED